jgi:outer membrane protein
MRLITNVLLFLTILCAPTTGALSQQVNEEQTQTKADLQCGLLNAEKLFRESMPALQASERLRAEFEGRDTEILKLVKEKNFQERQWLDARLANDEVQADALQKSLDKTIETIKVLQKKFKLALDVRQKDERTKFIQLVEATYTALAKREGYGKLFQEGETDPIFVSPGSETLACTSKNEITKAILNELAKPTGQKP